MCCECGWCRHNERHGATRVDDVGGRGGRRLSAGSPLDLLLHLLFSESSGDERGT